MSDSRISTLLADLRTLWRTRRTEVDSRWRRTLSFGDYVVDRWEKAQALGFGEGTSIYDSTIVLGDVRVGKNTWIGPFAVLDGSGGLQIGSNCSIGAGSQIYTHDTVEWATSGGVAPYQYAPTTIGDNCFLAPNVIVAKGITIGDGCVIGASSLVMHDLPPGSRAFGIPARTVADRRK